MSLSENPIQLPSSTTPEAQKDTVICRLCRRQFAKYTCPTCNAPYCSLTCFRSPAHNQCSESFYKKEIETDIHAGPSKTTQERQQMMELLKKFEEEAPAEQPLGEGDEEEDEDPSDLAKRFETVDLNSLSFDALWSMLTPEEHKKFTKVFDNPTSELAKQLLSSEQLEKELKEPWWEAPTLESEVGNAETHRYGARPSMMSIPMSMVTTIPAGHPLVYNIIAYAYITRHLGTSPLGSLKPEDPEYEEARGLVSQLVPFLTDRKSTQIYPNLPAVITGIWSLLEPGKMTSSLFSLLLRDAALLLKSLRVVQVVSSSKDGTVPPSHPHIMPVLALSDLNDLFSDSQTPSKPNHVTHKLRFYMAHILSTPSAILRSLSNEMVVRAKGYEQEEANNVDLDVKRVQQRDSNRFVEEISI